jgi:hypothetical protein
MVVDIWDIDKRKCTRRSDRVDQAKIANVQVERGSRRLSARAIEEGGDTRRVAGDVYGVHYSWWFGGLSLKTTGWTVSRFGPQNPSRGSEEEQTACGGIEEFVLR